MLVTVTDPWSELRPVQVTVASTRIRPVSEELLPKAEVTGEKTTEPAAFGSREGGANV